MLGIFEKRPYGAGRMTINNEEEIEVLRKSSPSFVEAIEDLGRPSS